MPTIRSESELVSLAIQLGARTVSGWSVREEELAREGVPVSRNLAEQFRQKIRHGDDPLGELFGILRSPTERRPQGATFTPCEIVLAMLDAIADQGVPDRVVDPGAGSGRFLMAAGNRFPKSILRGIELDPLAAILARANLAVRGFGNRSYIEVADYRCHRLPEIPGRTLYFGNPPYVRHHLINRKWKQWLVAEAKKFNISATQSAGLHIYFYLATAAGSKTGDFGTFITAAEWLDVNYGNILRELLLGKLGGKRIILVEPTTRLFPDAATTAAIAQFEIHSQPKAITFQRVKQLSEIARCPENRSAGREQLEKEQRWSQFTRSPERAVDGFVELGELCRVHRGQVTGANRIWVTPLADPPLPASVLFRSITRARELIRAGNVLDDVSHLRFVIDLPIDLETLEGEDRQAVKQFLARARRHGADKGYIATHRRAWWSVGLKEPASILATYMARRPPAFVFNQAGARHINIAHGLYPRESMSREMLQQLAAYLSQAVKISDGRTYAGGLTKFEPREMERLIVPGPELLMQGDRSLKTS